MISCLSVLQVLRLHQMQIDRFGGLPGLRDRALLESICGRPAATYRGEPLYPDEAAKAAALMHAVITNQPFVDGNKRVGTTAALVFLAANGLSVTADAEEIARLAADVEARTLGAEELTIWFRQKVRRRE